MREADDGGISVMMIDTLQIGRAWAKTFPSEAACGGSQRRDLATATSALMSKDAFMKETSEWLYIMVPPQTPVPWPPVATESFWQGDSSSCTGRDSQVTGATDARR